jgi:hypothetical protein
MMTIEREALKLALEALETELSIDWGNPDDFDTSAEKMHKAIAAIKEALAQPEQEPTSELHSCPYAEEINGDYETLCDCDEERTRQCAQDI